MAVQKYRLTLPSFIDGQLKGCGEIVYLEENEASSHMVLVEDEPVMPPVDVEEQTDDPAPLEPVIDPIPEPQDSVDVPAAIEPVAEQEQAPADDASAPAPDAAIPPVTIVPVEDEPVSP